MTSELSFQNTVINWLRAYGWKAYNMETNNPGFPDVAAYKGHEHRLVEVKVSDAGHMAAVKGLLTKAQLPWWIDYLISGRELWLMVKRSQTEILVHRITNALCHDIAHNVTMGEVDWKSFSKDREAVQWIIGER